MDVDGAGYKGRREIIFVVEGSKALEPHWPRIKDHYITQLIRQFYEAKRLTWLGLVVFTSHNSSCLVRRSCWTLNTLEFSNWLDDICFYNGIGPATTEGLAEALMMYSDVDAHGNYACQNSAFYQKHCLLIASTSPSNYPTAIPKLPAQNSEQNNCPGTSSELKFFYNFGDVAKSFAQCFISLSVISPTRCSIFENIFNMAKRDLRVTETNFENVENPDKFLILLSKNYPEAHMALNPSGMRYLSMHQVFMTDKTSQPRKKKLLMRRTHSGNRSLSRTRKVFGSIPPPVVKVEPFDVARPLSFHLPAYLNDQPSSTPLSPTFGNGLFREVKPQISGTQMNNGFSSHFSLPLSPYVLPSSLQHTGFLKVWEGYLSGEFLGLHVHIRFEGYRSAVASETLANDWPLTMQILCRVDGSTLEKCVYALAFIKQCVGKAEVLCFRKLDQPKLMYNSRSLTEWLLVRLPSQILLLCVSKRDDCCGGLLLSLHMEYLLYEFMVSQRLHKQQEVQPQKRARKIG